MGAGAGGPRTVRILAYCRAGPLPTSAAVGWPGPPGPPRRTARERLACPADRQRRHRLAPDRGIVRARAGAAAW